MTSEGLGEMFEGDSADTCAGKFPLVSMGGRADRQACADGERGPPLARAEFFQTLDMTSERLGRCLKVTLQKCVPGKFPLVSMGGRADTSSVRRRGVRTPIGASGN